MKKLKYLSILAAVAFASITLNSCVNDLDQIPLDPKVTTSAVTFTNTSLPYVEYIAKIYAGLSTGGIQGADNKVDITGYDGGSQAGYIRPLWNLQELPTDEAICCWQSDGTLMDFHPMTWNPANPYINGFYSRLYYQITIATGFLQETTADKLTARGVSQSLKDSINTFRAEARFLRALAYANVLDLFRNGPLVNDASPLGTSSLPPYGTAQQIFSYVESELTDCQTAMLKPAVGFGGTYGHANQAAAWALLARLYLNADTYLGTTNTVKYYTSCIDNCKKVIAAGYTLEPNYQNLYVTDNYNSKEIVFPVVFDGSNLTTWGGTMFLESSAVNGDIQALTGAPGAWGGNRAVKEFAARFTADEVNYTLDTRYARLYTGFSHPSIDDLSQFTQGVQVLKYSNKSSAGVKSTASFASTDFPLFRLGDIYLMYAEAVLRGGTSGDRATALGYINALRDRAQGSTGATDLRITDAQLTLAFILGERAREMFWECTRRSDLVRFGKLTTSDYLWEWKGGLKAGKGVDSHLNVYPLPSSDLGANPNLKQNTGY
jgi:hypothetical protein